jgi:hypothetical protein
LKNLEEAVPDGVFGYRSVLFRRLLGNGGEVATTAVFHENPSVSVDVSVVVSYNVAMMKILENVSMRSLLSVSENTELDRDAHFCYNLLSISLDHPLKVEFFAREYLRETPVSWGTGKCYQ